MIRICGERLLGFAVIVVTVVWLDLTVIQAKDLHQQHWLQHREQQELQCLTANVYWEARSEPVLGKIAVAQVTMNRVRSGRWPDSVCAVVHQRSHRGPHARCQFSWTCNARLRSASINDQQWQHSHHIAQQVFRNTVSVPELNHAYYFHSTSVQPRWPYQRRLRIGNHWFYSDRI